MRNIINQFKTNKNYISETDEFLARFDKQYPKQSESQEQEVEQYQTLFSQRDKKINPHCKAT